ncbi:MAG: hypothetical protein IKU60_06315, partial [Clostridia bacterium]|nr:hypothetical protein [Clostridia bacterium]
MPRNEIFEKALDLMIDEALNIYANNPSAPSPEVPEVQFSPEHEEKMQKLFKKVQREDMLRRIKSASKRVACILLIVLTVTGISISSVSAWREHFMKLIYNENSPNSDLYFLPSASGYMDSNITASYLPQGFELSKKTVTSKELI